jgi:hypothetical protein
MRFQTGFAKAPLYILFGNYRYFTQRDFGENQILCPAGPEYLPVHNQTDMPPRISFSEVS